MPSVTRMGSKLKRHIKCLFLDAFGNKKIPFFIVTSNKYRQTSQQRTKAAQNAFCGKKRSS
jgi:hypothetical protein